MNKPVAWYKKDSNDYLIENIGQPDFQVQEFIDAGYIPLYTHPVELTDEEIWDWFRENTALTKESALMIARAILRKAGEK